MILYFEWGRRGNDGSVVGKEIKSASLCFLCSDLLKPVIIAVSNQLYKCS